MFRVEHAFVWRTLRSLGVPAAFLDDAVQDVFVTAYRRVHTYAGRGSTRSWLAGIARRIAFRYRRSESRQQRRHDALRVSPVQPIATTRAEADEWMRRREADTFLHRFLDDLEPAKREVFVLCDLEGLRGREAAEALGVNQNTASARLRAARRQFERACARARVEPGHPRAAAAQDPPQEAKQRTWALIGAKIQLGAGLGASAAPSGVAGSTAAASASAASVPMVAAAGAGTGVTVGWPALGVFGLAVALGVGIATAVEERAPAVAPGYATGAGGRDGVSGPALADQLRSPRVPPADTPDPVAAGVDPVSSSAPAVPRPHGAGPPSARGNGPAEGDSGGSVSARSRRDTPRAGDEPASGLTEAEVDLAEQVTGAFEARRWAEARDLARTYRRRHPRGDFTLEVLTVEVVSRCRLGDGDGARRVARAALGRGPGDELLARRGRSPQ